MRIFNLFQRKTVAFNILFMLIVILAFASLFSSILDFFSFSSYIFLLLVGGIGFASLFKNYFEDGITFLIISLLIGITLNYALFILLKFFGINDIYSVVLIFVISLALIKYNFNDIKRKISKINILKDKKFILILLIILFSFLILSDRVTYTGEGVYVHDSLHPNYELSVGQSLNTILPMEDISYEGKELRYHIGYPIMLNQLVNNFGINGLNLVYVIFPSFLVFLIVLLLYQISINMKCRSPIFFCILVLFSTLSVPLSRIFLILNKLFELNLDTALNPVFLFFRIMVTGSIGLGILMTLALFLLLRQKKRSYAAEAILLTGIAVTKITFFIPLAIAYGAVFFFKWMQDKDFTSFVKKVLILVPGVLYAIFFVLGAHQQNLWAIFPGFFNLRSTQLGSNYLLFNAAGSLFITTFIFLGIGLVYLYPQIVSLMNKKELLKKLRGNDTHLFILSIILVSFLLAIFFVEVTEGNHNQFLIPGSMILSLLTYHLLLNSRKFMKTIWTVLIVMLVINASVFLGIYSFLPTMKMGSEDIVGNNALANLKLTSVRTVPQFNGLGLTPNCFYSNDLMKGMQYLEKSPEGNFVINIIHQDCENYKSDSWKTRSGFIRTALAKKQTVIENYKYKGIVAEGDYCVRAFENIFFYTMITGKQESLSQIKQLFLNSDKIHFEELSYYTYLKYFSNQNYYSYNTEVFSCIIEKISAVENKIVPPVYLDKYLAKYNVDYVVFERGEEPLEEYVDQLGLNLVYSSNIVKIYNNEMNFKDK